MKVYDEIEYWNERQNPNFDNWQRKRTQKSIDELKKKSMSYIRKYVSGLDRILDFGPGVGSIFPAYDKVKFVEGFDISLLYKERIMKESEKYDFKFTLTIGTQVGQLPYGDKEFDAGIAVSVLLHQRPVNIYKVMSELIRVSKKVVVVSSYDKRKEFDDPEVESKNFTHVYNYSYLDICDTHNWIVEDVVFPSNEGIYFVFK